MSHREQGRTIDIPGVNELLAQRMHDLVITLAGEPSQRGRDTWRLGRRGSLAIQVQGSRRGAWHDHEAGVGGDPLGLVAHLRRQPMREAFIWALGWLGEDRERIAPPARAYAPSAREPEPPSTMDLARRIWREATDAAGTPAASYLASRGLRPDHTPLRFHPACPRGKERHPAMLALMTEPLTGAPCGVHRTFLAPDGQGKAEGQAKLMAGRAGVIRLSADCDLTSGLGIAEGIETALSVMQCFGWGPVWAAASAGAIARFPILRGIEALTIFADPDGAGLKAAEDCAMRWRQADIEARVIAPPEGDWNDVHRAFA